MNEQHHKKKYVNVWVKKNSDRETKNTHTNTVFKLIICVH